MGYIEIKDGSVTRRIPVSEIPIPVRIVVSGPDAPKVVVPHDASVEFGVDGDVEDGSAPDHPPGFLQGPSTQTG